MIATIAALVAGNVEIDERAVAGMTAASVALVISIPEEMESVRSPLQEAVRLLPDGSAVYTRRSLASLTVNGPVRSWILPDYVGIQFSVPVDLVPSAVTALYGFLYRPNLTPRDQPTGDVDWYAPLWQFQPKRDPAEREVRQAWDYLVKKGRVRISVRGGDTPGAAARTWASLSVSDPASRLPAELPRPDGDRIPAAANAIWLDGPETKSPAAAALAAILIGQGKSSELFRVAREAMGISYRQEAFLWPSRNGWTPRIFLTGADPVSRAQAEQLRERLIANASAWTDADLVRAKSCLRESLAGTGVWSPLMAAPGNSLGNGAGDLAILDAVTGLFGAPLDPSVLAVQAQSEDLDAVKRCAREWLTGSIEVRSKPQ
jgi:hypothetical protein